MQLPAAVAGAASLLLATLVAPGDAITLRPRSVDETPRVLGLPLQRRQTDRPVASSALQRRSKTVPVSLQNFEVSGGGSRGSPLLTMMI